MSEVSGVLFERVRKTLRQKNALTCELGKCLRGECSITECPVEEWISELKSASESIYEKTLSLEAKVFHALSDPIRVKIVKLLAIKRELCSCEIQVAIAQSQSLTSYHLGLLREAGILRTEKHGVWAYYKISSPKAVSMINMADKIIKETLNKARKE
jgi:ArsR family transcriptional regulator